LERYKTFSESHQGPRTNLRVGGEIDAWCTRCHLVLSHTILAMRAGEPIRVECCTCKSQHKYHIASPVDTPPVRGVRNTAKNQHTARPAFHHVWDEITNGLDLSKPIPYHPNVQFEKGQVIIHGKFGVGVVMEVKEGGKILVVFRDETRVLVHTRT
jgi:hypothetical protein